MDLLSFVFSFKLCIEQTYLQGSWDYIAWIYFSLSFFSLKLLQGHRFTGRIKWHGIDGKGHKWVHTSLKPER
jgi:hypothetical protein